MLVAVFFVLVAVVVVAIAYRILGGMPGVSLVQPILLDDALDTDLRELREAVRKDIRLEPHRRRALSQLIVTVAANRQEEGHTDEREQAMLQAAWDELARSS